MSETYRISNESQYVIFPNDAALLVSSQNVLIYLKSLQRIISI